MRSLKRQIDWNGDLEKQHRKIRANMNKEVREKCYQMLAHKSRKQRD